MLQINQYAPDFYAKTISGKDIQLSQFKGKKTMLKFHRFSGCPVCRIQLNEFVQCPEKLLNAGIEVILIMHSSTNKVLPNFVERPGIHIIPDREKKLYTLYHSRFLPAKLFSYNSWKFTFKAISKGYFPQFNRIEGGITGVPSDFLLDENGKIIDLHYGTHFGDSWNLDIALQRAQTAA